MLSIFVYSMKCLFLFKILMHRARNREGGRGGGAGAFMSSCWCESQIFVGKKCHYFRVAREEIINKSVVIRVKYTCRRKYSVTMCFIIVVHRCLSVFKCLKVL